MVFPLMPSMTEIGSFEDIQVCIQGFEERIVLAGNSLARIRSRPRDRVANRDFSKFDTDLSLFQEIKDQDKDVFIVVKLAEGHYSKQFTVKSNR
jgi:hypothetical protein